MPVFRSDAEPEVELHYNTLGDVSQRPPPIPARDLSLRGSELRSPGPAAYFDLPREGGYEIRAAEGESDSIADPRTFPALYFLKGALALHALRMEMGDPAFFRGFRRIFEVRPARAEWTLEDFRAVFEKEHGKDLSGFFQRWYFSVGLPS